MRHVGVFVPTLGDNDAKDIVCDPDDSLKIRRDDLDVLFAVWCPMGDNDKFCGACGAPNAGAAASAPQGQPQQFVPQPPVANASKGCVAQAFEDMTKTPGVLQRVCQIAFYRR